MVEMAARESERCEVNLRYKTSPGIRGIYGARLFVESTYPAPLPNTSAQINALSVWGGIDARGDNWVAWEFGNETSLAFAIAAVESAGYVRDNGLWEDR